ncbi:MAG TPA: DUF4351 domain-containing protein [Steroidobacteraceae bacterium]|nr:DUF4351 domain-containing protein [Steroidobacteraceae bacterium]
MPSQLHEALLLLFRNRPQLAPDLLRDALQMNVPQYSEVRIDSADLTDIQPAEYRADLVVLLLENVPVLGIVVEAQLSPNERKRLVWPVYVANLRARLECPVCLLVVTADELVARWAAKPIDMGAGNSFVPLVLRPSGVPEVTDDTVAHSDPELAVLSAMVHGQDADIHKAAQIALAAQLASLGLDEDRSRLYFDLVLASLSEAARRELQTMDPAKYEYQSDFAKRYVAQGRAEGRAALILKQLALRFGPLGEETSARIVQASIEELDAIGERLIAAQTLQDALAIREL